MPIALDVLAGQDISELEAKAAASAEENKKHDKALMVAGKDSGTDKGRQGTEREAQNSEKSTSTEVEPDVGDAAKIESPADNIEGSGGATSNPDQTDEQDESDAEDESYMSVSEQNMVYLGLRVYTENIAADVCGQLRHEMATSFEGLAIKH